MGLSSLAIINHTTSVGEAELARFTNALDVQLRRDVTPVWNRYLLPWVARTTSSIDPKAWQLHLWNEPRNASEFGMMGHHTTQGKDHVPVGHVFIESCRRNQLTWTMVASHEAVEMVGDEWVNLDVARILGDGSLELWPRELCDAVQGVGYAVNGVMLSDFVYPEYFISGSDGPYDHCRELEEPFGIHKTGYASVLTIKNGIAQRRDQYGANHVDWHQDEKLFARMHERWRSLT